MYPWGGPTAMHEAPTPRTGLVLFSNQHVAAMALHAHHGDSGSPVRLASGEALGIVSATVGYPVSVAFRLERGLEMAEAAGIHDLRLLEGGPGPLG